MAQTVLMVYENLESLKDNKNYWKSYVEFYEKYWDAPATPKSSWWGIEYEEFRKSLSEQLGLDKKSIKDCFFTKDKDNNYYVCPIGMEVNLNIMASDNIVPLEWFVLFDSEQKSYFYTHTGFGAIHHDAIYYSSEIQNSIERMILSESVLSDVLDKQKDELKKYHNLKKIHYILEGIRNIAVWLKGFTTDGIVMLNYGEICSFIEPDSIKNEDSVGEMNQIIENLRSGDLTLAETNLKLLDLKWSDIASKASGKFETRSLQ
ncbi:MAG: hypothetical protein ACR2NW_05965 [Thermodesulfobacteriota bacterium]